MKPFLKEIAEELFTLYGERMEELCLVFPNRRAGLFFNKYLGGCLTGPVWSPSIYTIQDLMAGISDLAYADELELISELFRVYTGVRGREESFDDFYYWGEVMLADFDDVDKYMVRAADLFRNLADLKQMEDGFQYLSEQQIELIQRFWGHFSTDRQSEQKKQFIEVWNILHPVYDRLRENLLGKGTGYEGMIYRNVAERIKEGETLNLPASIIVFIGFNALNPCEEVLFRSLADAGKAMFYWDFDNYYLENEMHEAGRFIRKNLDKYKDSGHRISHDNMLKSGKQIEVYSMPGGSGQAQLIHRILGQARQSKAPGEETAIILADEELLIPVLHALPENLEEINVTMGFPVKAAPVFSLIEHLIALQRNIREWKNDTIRFYYADVLAVLQHQYILTCEPADVRVIVKEIHEKNRIYLSTGDLKKNDLFIHVFKKLGNPEDIADYLMSILEYITRSDDGESNAVPALELEFIYRVYTRIKRLKDVISRLDLSFTLPTFLRLFHKILQRTSIPFSGEPLSGIQVMGVLETRVLDFDRIILLSMNEGAFPKTSTSASFIPHNLRFGFNLPTLEYQDAIYAYYFYRLIHRAQEISLVYNNQNEGLNTGEKSRYIHQLRYEPAFEVREYSAGFDLQSGQIPPIHVRKTGPIMDELLNYAAAVENGHYFSPSALNSLIDCTLRFYFRYIAGLKEPDELKEEVDPALFGTLLHESIRKIYGGLENPIQKADIESVVKDAKGVRKAINEAFAEVWYKNRTGVEPEGRNLVIREIIFTYLQKIMERDQEYCPINIYSLEKPYFTGLAFESSGQNHTVKIGGKIDRIDESGGMYRVLDYKTGAGEMTFESIQDLFEGEQKNRNRAAFQTFLYAKVFASHIGMKEAKIMPGIYLIRDIYSQDFNYIFRMGPPRKHIPIEDYSNFDEVFTEHLRALLSALYDPEVPFQQTAEEENCRNCPYRGICHR
ncbi:MAG: hypothetical protein AMS26_05525 [Bacteroides sp. SM23_62]|nr:MAG: hypothetical protein AMS26_05525 [Bacteroides sp. SM23_62]